MKPSESNFTESGTPRSSATRCGSPPFGSTRQISLAPITGKYSSPSGPTSIALSIGMFSSRIRGSPVSRSSSISRPPSRISPMNNRSWCTVMPFAQGMSSRSTRAAAAGVEHAHSAVHHLGGVEVAARIEGDVVGRDDVAALRADGVQPAGAEVQRADLAAGHLRDVDAPVGTGAQTVGAEQSTRRGEALQPPALGGGGVGCDVPGVVDGDVMTPDVIKPL